MADVPKVLDEHECIDLQCGHFDGDQCTLGACLDPPADYEASYNDWLTEGDIKGDIAREEDYQPDPSILDPEEVANE
jgi:hypothetical protein